MRDNERGEAEESSDWRLPRLDRRSVLRAVGAGTALTTAGAAAAQSNASDDADDGNDDGGSDDGGNDDSGNDDGSGDDDGIDPAFGYPALAGDDDPPEEPDHVVEIHIQPREDAPIPEFYFEPTGLSIEPGDTVQFLASTPHHTVTAYHPAFGYARRVPDGVPPFSSPVLSAEGYWLYTFEKEGVYDFHCAPHEVYGHAGRIVVGGDTDGFEPVPDPCAGGEGTTTPAETAAATETPTPTPAENGENGDDAGGGNDGGEGGEQPELEPPRLTATTVLRDPALEPENIIDAGEVSWDDLDDESKQLFLQISGFPPCE